MDWEYYIDNDLSRSIITGGVYFLSFRIWYKYANKSQNAKIFLKFLENSVWHPKNCFINMKLNTRYFYTIIMGSISITAIQFFYFFITNHIKLDFNYFDYSAVGGLSAFFVGALIFGFSSRLNLIFFSVGVSYGLIYVWAIKHFVNLKKKRADKLGIRI